MSNLWLLIVWAASGVLGAPGQLPSLEDDTTCVTPEQQWFDASQHEHSLASWFAAARAGSEHTYHCLDWFGASQAVTKCWVEAGYAAIPFDIKLSRDQDLTSEGGCKILLGMAARLHSKAAVICAPPCSLFSPACASVHMRSPFFPEGDTSVFLVRLANLIHKNTASLIRIILAAIPTLALMVEQPSGSWSYKTWFMEILIEDFHLILICTWLSYWSHDLLKCTHLLSNRRTAVKDFQRKLKAEDRRRFQERFEERQRQRGDNRKVYHQRVKKRNGTWGWQGGKDLSSSAEFTREFCLALLQWWQRESGM